MTRHLLEDLTIFQVESSGSVGRGLVWGSNNCWFETHQSGVTVQDTYRLLNHVYFLLVLFQPRETGNHPNMTEKLLTGT